MSAQPNAEVASLREAYYAVGGAANFEHILSPQARCALLDRWYASLAAGTPDYSVYADERFLAEAYACWLGYSRHYIKQIAKIRHRFTDVRSVLDVGCGLGLTCRWLMTVFPQATVCGTNVAGSLQYAIAQRFSAQYGFSLSEVPRAADLVFASEYFEHFERPIEHLHAVLDAASPRYLVIANSFGSHSTGHFDQYMVEHQPVPNKTIGRKFNAALRARGFAAMPGLKFWNNRPSIWQRTPT